VFAYSWRQDAGFEVWRQDFQVMCKPSPRLMSSGTGSCVRSTFEGKA
jgi:hypothetical protein